MPALWRSSWTAIRRGADATRLFMSSESRNDSMVAGMLRETICVKVAPIFADAKSANNEPITVMPAVSPSAR